MYKCNFKNLNIKQIFIQSASVSIILFQYLGFLSIISKADIYLLFMFLLFLIATLRRVWKVKPLSQPKIEIWKSYPHLMNHALVSFGLYWIWTSHPLRVLSIIHLRKGILLVYYLFLMVRNRTDLCGGADVFPQMCMNTFQMVISIL